MPFGFGRTKCPQDRMPQASHQLNPALLEGLSPGICDIANSLHLQKMMRGA